MLPRNHPDRIRIAFDDHRLVANAGLILPSTLALRLGRPNWLTGAWTWACNRQSLHRRQADDAGGFRASWGDCIDDAAALRAGGTARVLGFTAKAPSTPRFREGRLWAPSCAASGGAMSAKDVAAGDQHSCAGICSCGAFWHLPWSDQG